MSRTWLESIFGKLNWLDTQGHTPVCIRSHNSHSMPGQKQSQDVQGNSCVPRNTMAWNGRSLEPTWLFLLLVFRPTELSDLSHESNQEPNSHSHRSPLQRWEKLLEGGTSQRHSWLMKAILSKRHITAHLELAKWCLNDSESTRNNILWSDETKFDL